MVEKQMVICYRSVMTPERHHIPGWARKERQRDLEWIRENLHIFLPAAGAAFQETGRGAIVVDVTSRPTGEGHPFSYFPQEVLEQYEDKDINRMMKEYNPAEEFVVVLLKSKNRTSTYRVQPQQKR